MSTKRTVAITVVVVVVVIATLIGMAVVIGVLLSTENPMLDMTCELVSQTINCRSYAGLEIKLRFTRSHLALSSDEGGSRWEVALCMTLEMFSVGTK